MLTPMMAEQLNEAAQSYAPQWVEEAFGIAAQRDKRNWRYVEAILQRWAREGKGNMPQPAKIQPRPALRAKRHDKATR